MSTTAPAARADTAPPAYTAKLIEAAQYYLIGGRLGPDVTFTRGEEVEVSQEVFEHLSTQTRPITHREANRVTREERRLFALRGPDGVMLPRTRSETVRQLDGADEPDPWAAT